MSTGQQTACKNFLPVLFEGYVMVPHMLPASDCVHVLFTGLVAVVICSVPAWRHSMTAQYALRSERCVHDVVAHRDPTVHATASGFKARRLRATREVSNGTSRQRRCPVCVVRTGACSTAERRSTRPVPPSRR